MGKTSYESPHVDNVPAPGGARAVVRKEDIDWVGRTPAGMELMRGTAGQVTRQLKTWGYEVVLVPPWQAA